MCLSCARQTESQCVMKRKCEAEGTAITSQWVWKWGEQVGGNKGLYLLKKFLDSLTRPNLILFVSTRCSIHLLPYTATQHANPAVYLAGRGISIEFNLNLRMYLQNPTPVSGALP